MVRLEEDWTGKIIFLKTETGRFINGTVLSHDGEFLKIKDKYGMLVYILEKEIEILEEKSR
jgi:hypothetical protein